MNHIAESSYPMRDGIKISFSGKYRDAIFGDDLLNHPDHDRFGYLDDVQEYRLNSYGYRGPEFNSNTDLLFAGCSFTYGTGIPEDGIWGSLIAQQMNMSYNNISSSGASIDWIVRQLFAYFKKYGNPKTLLCLFPNPTKIFFASDSEILISDDGYVEKTTQDIHGLKSLFSTTLHRALEPRDRPEYSKKPHKLEDVVSMDFVIQTCMQSIRSLEQYCRATGINFYWSTWSKDFSFILEQQGLVDLYDFNNYVRLDHHLWSRRDGAMSNDLFYKDLDTVEACTKDHYGVNCSCFIECHSELIPKYGNQFYTGTDVFEKHPHFGVHRHVHMAESFIKRINNN